MISRFALLYSPITPEMYKTLLTIASTEAFESPCSMPDRKYRPDSEAITAALFSAGLIELVYVGPVELYSDRAAFLILTQAGLDYLADARTTAGTEFHFDCPAFECVNTILGVYYRPVFKPVRFWGDFFSALSQYARRARGINQVDYAAAYSLVRQRNREFNRDERLEAYSFREGLEYDLSQDTTLAAHISWLARGTDMMEWKVIGKHQAESRGELYCWAKEQRDYLRMIADDRVPF